jgi:hypothetical protein
MHAIGSDIGIETTRLDPRSEAADATAFEGQKRVLGMLASGRPADDILAELCHDLDRRPVAIAPACHEHAFQLREAALEPGEGSQVRTRLRAGGNRIRTLGPPNRELSFSCVMHAERPEDTRTNFGAGSRRSHSAERYARPKPPPPANPGHQGRSDDPAPPRRGLD